jgi:hypothetical protein
MVVHYFERLTVDYGTLALGATHLGIVSIRTDPGVAAGGTAGHDVP